MAFYYVKMNLSPKARFTQRNGYITDAAINSKIRNSIFKAVHTYLFEP